MGPVHNRNAHGTHEATNCGVCVMCDKNMLRNRRSTDTAPHRGLVVIQ